MNNADESSSLGHTPGTKWEFDATVAAVFDDMLRRSIPQYDVMRDAVFQLGAPFVAAAPSSDVVDLGASRGEAVSRFVDRFGMRNRYMLVEVAPPMVKVLRERFARWITPALGGVDPGVGQVPFIRVSTDDLRSSYPSVLASLTLSVLTLQFIPIEYRPRIVHRAYESTAPGGAFILVEKVLGGDAVFQDAFVREYQEMKIENGYSQEEVDRKALALEGVLVSQTAAANEAMLRAEGFAHVECFWRWMNFAGWLAIKS